jgi:hypothetical protein
MMSPIAPCIFQSVQPFTDSDMRAMERRVMPAARLVFSRSPSM